MDPQLITLGKKVAQLEARIAEVVAAAGAPPAGDVDVARIVDGKLQPLVEGLARVERLVGDLQRIVEPLTPPASDVDVAPPAVEKKSE